MAYNYLFYVEETEETVELFMEWGFDNFKNKIDQKHRQEVIRELVAITEEKNALNNEHIYIRYSSLANNKNKRLYCCFRWY